MRIPATVATRPAAASSALTIDRLSDGAARGHARHKRAVVVLLLLVTPALAEGIDREGIAEGIAKIKPKIAACSDRSEAGGTVKVEVKVAPSGTLSSVVVKATPSEALGECVAEAIRTAAFPATKDGGVFSYPFVFEGVPEALDREAISAGIAQIEPRLAACGGKAKGTVKVKVTVIPSGKVSNLEILATPDRRPSGLACRMPPPALR